MAKKKKTYTVTKVNSIREVTELAVKEAGDQLAYRYKEKGSDDKIVDVTFKGFYDDVENLGSALTARGYGDAHIACVSANCYRYIVTYVSVLESAGVFVPVDAELPTNEMLHVLNNSDSTVIFYSEKLESWMMENRESLPNVKCFVGIDRTEDDGDFLSFDKLLEEGSKLDRKAYDSLKSDEYDLKLLVYTSGTTGVAKGVMLTEHNLVSLVYYGPQVSTVYDTGLSVLPYHHTYEAVCDILVALHMHVTLCINESLKKVQKNMQLYKPAYMMVVPAFAEEFYSAIMRNIRKKGIEKQFNTLIKLSNGLRKVGIDMRRKFFKEIHENFGGKLKKLVCGGAPIRYEINKFFDDIGLILTGGYGITECSPLVCVNDENSNCCYSAGHKLDCIEWKIDAPDADGIGEICVKGDTVMKGYYKNPEKTAEVLKDGWFYTGDYGYITPDDQLVITGRKKNIIVLNNGKNIYPEEIENYIQDIDYISEVVVRGIKNDFGEETGLLAEVYMPEPHPIEEVTADIKKTLADLPGYKKVSKVVIREIPFEKTSSRKIRR